MDDLDPLVYIVLAVIYFLARAFRGAKKLQKQPPPQKPAETPSQPPVVVPPQPVFTEMKKTVSKPEIKIRQKVFVPEKKARKSEGWKREPMPGSIEVMEPHTAPIEHIEKETGYSSLQDKMKQMFAEEAKESAPLFEFDPRQAFMMKTLLERKFDI